MSPGAPMREPADAGALIDTVRGQTDEARQQKLGSHR